MQIFLGLLACAAAPATANAQSAPSDVRCLLLSNAFSRAEDPKVRDSATQSKNFYLGRVETRTNDQAITSEIRTQATSIDRTQAATDMAACVARLVLAQQRLQRLAQAARPPK